MYKVEPNKSNHRPKELPFLVRETESNLIARYYTSESEAEGHAKRLNERYFPVTGQAIPEEKQNVEFGETLSLF
jgi:hypothetical protein